MIMINRLFINVKTIGETLAWVDCSKLKMKLAVLDTMEKITCVSNAMAGAYTLCNWWLLVQIILDCYVAAMTTSNKLVNPTLRLYGGNMNVPDTYIWCENQTSLDSSIAGAGSLDYTGWSTLALLVNSAAPALSKLVSSNFGASSSALCEEWIAFLLFLQFIWLIAHPAFLVLRNVFNITKYWSKPFVIIYISFTLSTSVLKWIMNQCVPVKMQSNRTSC